MLIRLLYLVRKTYGQKEELNGNEYVTLEELWELFPIVLAPHNHKWIDWAKQEIEL